VPLALPSQHGLSPVFSAPGHPVSRYRGGLYPQNEEETHSRKLFIASNLPRQAEFKSTNAIFWGRRGKGKTLSMVGISKILAPGFRDVGWRVQANIPLDFSDIGVQTNCHPLLGLFIAQDMPRAERSLIDFDELTEIVPSRAAMTKANRSSLSVMVQIRKLMCEVMTTTQFPTSIDKQMLQQLDLYVLCDAWIPKDARWNPASARNAFVKLYVFDLWGQFTGNFMPSRYFPPPLWMAMKVLYLRNLPAAWGSYNTRQLVVSAHASDEQKERMISRSWDLDTIERVEEAEQERVLAANPAERDYDVEATVGDRMEEVSRSIIVEMNPAEKEFDEAVEARFREAQARPTPPPEAINISLTPQTEDAWLRHKRMAGRFRLTVAMIPDLRRFGLTIHNLADVTKVLRSKGFDVELKDGAWWAQVAG